MSHQGLKFLYAGLCFIAKMTGYIAGMFLGRESISDLVNLAVGGGLTAISLVHLLPRAEDFISGSYPFAALVAIVVFAILTLFTFVRDSIALMDDNILATFEAVNIHTITNTDLLNEQLLAKKPEIDFLENLPTMFLYFTAILNSITCGILLASITDSGVLNKHASLHIAIGLIEFVAISRYVNLVPLPRIAYWGLGVLAALIEAVIVAVPVGGISLDVMKQLSGYTSAVIIGIYIFLGSGAIHNGLTQSKHSLAISAVIMLMSFTIPSLIPPSLRSGSVKI